MHQQLCGKYNVPGVPSVYFSQCEMHAYPQKKLSCLATMLKLLLNFKELESSVKPTFGISRRISLAEKQETHHGELGCAFNKHMVYSTLTVVQCRSQFEYEFCLDSKINLEIYFRCKQWQATPLISNDIRPSSTVLYPYKTGLLKKSQAPLFR